jgi:hypothetical protein
MLPLATAPQKALVCLLEGVSHTGMLEAPKECRAALEGLLAIALLTGRYFLEVNQI